MTVAQILQLSFMTDDTPVTIMSHTLNDGTALAVIKHGTRLDSDITNYNAARPRSFTYYPIDDKLIINNVVTS